MTFSLTSPRIRDDLDALAEEDPRLAAMIARVGYPQARQRPPGFETLLRIMSGQQLSVKAAGSIHDRLSAHLGAVTPQAVLALSPETMRTLGLSRQKARYAHALAQAMTDGTLDLDALPDLDDEQAQAAITAVTGFGAWSAHMYLMFALGRGDVWPAGDLAVRKGAALILEHAGAPDEKLCRQWGEAWRPRRSAVALLCWRAYSSPAL